MVKIQGGFLANLDLYMNSAYKQALKESEADELIIETQRSWLQKERNTCREKFCVKDAYLRRLEFLSKYLKPLDPKNPLHNLNIVHEVDASIISHADEWYYKDFRINNMPIGSITTDLNDGRCFIVLYAFNKEKRRVYAGSISCDDLGHKAKKKW